MLKLRFDWYIKAKTDALLEGWIFLPPVDGNKFTIIKWLQSIQITWRRVGVTEWKLWPPTFHNLTYYTSSQPWQPLQQPYPYWLKVNICRKSFDWVRKIASGFYVFLPAGFRLAYCYNKSKVEELRNGKRCLRERNFLNMWSYIDGLLCLTI